ncbi:hypothetical protein HYALB_00013920 [Hymenoscyphus albidus]|uniref:Zn(2)-C6 fungal-type domain-containing protein n=1 Tax=Hymenoscyphus albidus TaxID=595503 RepID=A0A9N9Q6Q0_9HELO|nr:hypothetical protein HYALB_00013920 [Hymenoscyphus albidus]
MVSLAQLQSADSSYHANFKTLWDEFCMVQKSISLILLCNPTTSSAPMRTVGPGQRRSHDEGDSSLEPSLLLQKQNPSLSNPHTLSENNSKPRDNSRFSPSENISGKIPYVGGGLVPSTRIPKESRKGHKKSRRGCFSCKRRKIKCQETQPSCENCIKIQSSCVYPQPQTLSALHESSAYAANPVTSINLQATPVIFSLADMRLFHHFLQDAYPHLPVGNDTAWTTQVPLIAHHNEYVMHAILGMAATHLQLVTGTPLCTTALQHRVHAIAGSNQALSRPTRTGVDGDALLASCYLLVFQSSYMADGMREFFRMIRGCAMLTMQLRAENIPMAFFLPNKYHFSVMQERLVDLPVIDERLVESARKSLELLPHDRFDCWHTAFYNSLISTLDSLAISSLQSYFKFLLIYQDLLKMDTLFFNSFLDHSNHLAHILLVHLLAIELILEPIIEREFGGRRRPMSSRFHLDWISCACNEMPVNMRHYLKWPSEMADLFGRSTLRGKGLV